MVCSYRYSANCFPQNLRQDWVARSLFPNRNSYQIVTSQRNIKKRNQWTGLQKISLNSIDQKSVIYKFSFHISFAIVLLTYMIGLLFFFKYNFEAQVISKQYLFFPLVNYKKLICHFTHESCRKKYFLGTIPKIYNIDIIFRTFSFFFLCYYFIHGNYFKNFIRKCSFIILLVSPITFVKFYFLFPLKSNRKRTFVPTVTNGVLKLLLKILLPQSNTTVSLPQQNAPCYGEGTYLTKRFQPMHQQEELV